MKRLVERNRIIVERLKAENEEVGQYLKDAFFADKRISIRNGYNEEAKSFVSVGNNSVVVGGDKFNHFEAVGGEDPGCTISTAPGGSINLMTLHQKGPARSEMIWPLKFLPSFVGFPCPSQRFDIPFGPLVTKMPELLGQMANLTAMACWVAVELYGPNDPKTHLARFWTLTNSNIFTKLYIKHGKKWSEWIKKYKILRLLAKPIWNRMAKKGQFMINDFVNRRI